MTSAQQMLAQGLKNCANDLSADLKLKLQLSKENICKITIKICFIPRHVIWCGNCEEYSTKR